MTTLEHPAPARVGEKLVGRVAFVTGGTRGIGAAICRSLASQGATVAAGYNSGRDRAEALRQELAQYSGESSTHQGNIGSAEDCRRTIGEVIERHGRLDILVNNAGITSDKTVLSLRTRIGTRSSRSTSRARSSCPRPCSHTCSSAGPAGS